MVYEAKSLDVFQKLFMEPEVLALSAYETYEVKLAFGMEEAKNGATSQMTSHLNKKLLFFF